MCGIFCSLRNDAGNNDRDVEEQLISTLSHRGPDGQHSFSYSIDDKEVVLHHVFLYGATLHMQGPQAVAQPVRADDGFLLFNGDIFDREWKKDECDTNIILNMINDGSGMGQADRETHIVSTLRLFRGPFSIIYLDSKNLRLYFTRDRIGRNSLLLYMTNDEIILSNVLNRKYTGTIEVPTTHIYSIDLKTNRINCYDWKDVSQGVSNIDSSEWFEETQILQHNSRHEVCVEASHQFIPPDEKDLELIDYICKTAQETKSRHAVMQKLFENEVILNVVDNILMLLRKSVEIRVETQPFRCQKCIKCSHKCENHSSLGILFSGGLDCSLLALLAHEFVPEEESIDLLNVAFTKGDKTDYNVPDRITGRTALKELCSLCPNRKWNFFEINISEDELKSNQKLVIADLVFPRQTILDESLGSALWFAARGIAGQLTSSSRVLLLGSGADELFGGYTRHRNALRRSSWEGLHNELLLDWNRIAHRNLARDNRVICDHGRQPRMPYLDEDFTNYALQLKPWERCIPNQQCEAGFGDKLYLRLAACKLGFKDVANLQKRAIQFGSRIANKKENGSDLSERFMNL